MVKIRDIELGDFPLLLAPMEDVSDPPFRALCKENGADLMFTEFISTEGLIRNADKSIQKLDIYEAERPIGIQIFGGEIESMRMATQIVSASEPDILDINYGCPVKNVTNKGAGAAILKDIPKMVKMTSEVVKSTTLPVTVKTRLGWDENSKYVIEVAERLQDVGIEAISVHGRTRVQMYKGEADWRLIGEIKNNPRIHIPVFGNGDVDSPMKAIEMKNRYGVDGVMIGRAAIGYPWVFSEIKHYIKYGEMPEMPSIKKRIDVCQRHLLHSLDWKGTRIGIFEMRKHYSNYFKGIPNIKPYRVKLTMAKTLNEIQDIFGEIYERITAGALIS
ncbi:MAG: tRNA dihydrouridine synthase DusB [Bacteroidetes bacterium]|nr:tRNA dihydrouridine synthase DusB [Bacteroidota bacterium]